VGGLRIVGRGLRDTYDNLFGFCLATIGWWLAALPVVLLWPFISWFALVGWLLFGPAATVTLFAVTDPRRAVERPDVREVVGIFWGNLTYGWKLILATLPVPLVLLNNLVVFGGSEDSLAVLAPLWAVLLLISIGFLLLSFAVAGIFATPLRETLKRATFVLVTAPFRSLFVLAVLLLWVLLGTGLVVPIVLFVPALVAATLDRLVVRVFDLPVVDPNAPTEERLHERATGTGQAKGGLRGRWR
jgi:hypothetical protein